MSVDFFYKNLNIILNLGIIDIHFKLTPLGCYIIKNNINIIQLLAILCDA